MDGDGVMTHYFKNDESVKSNPQVIAFRVNETPLKFNTDNGVFSKDSFDRGTEVLLKFVDINDSHRTALDLGCGYGVVGTYLQVAHNLQVDMVDINHRALELAKSNLALNGATGEVYESDGFNNIEKSFDLIITNPPIRAGKEVVYRFFEDAAKHLNENGDFYVVVNKKHGALSAFKKLETLFHNVELMGRKKGFHVYKCRNHLTL